VVYFPKELDIASTQKKSRRLPIVFNCRGGVLGGRVCVSSGLE